MLASWNIECVVKVENEIILLENYLLEIILYFVNIMIFINKIALFALLTKRKFVVVKAIWVKSVENLARFFI